MERDYGKGRIYQIVCNITGDIYIGSTINLLVMRLAEHFNGYKKWIRHPNKYSYLSVFPILERGNMRIELIEEYPCKSEQELKIRERYWFDMIPCVNLIRPHRTDLERQRYKAEWFQGQYEASYAKCFWRLFETEDEKTEKRELQKEKTAEYMCEYRSKEENKQKHKEYAKQHRDNNIQDYLEREKNRRESIKKDPEKLAEHREYQKQWARKKRAMIKENPEEYEKFKAYHRDRQRQKRQNQK